MAVGSIRWRDDERGRTDLSPERDCKAVSASAMEAGGEQEATGSKSDEE